MNSKNPASKGICQIEFWNDEYRVKATIGGFLLTVFVEEISVYDKQTNVIIKTLDPETLSDLKDLAIAKYKELK